MRKITMLFVAAAIVCGFAINAKADLEQGWKPADEYTFLMTGVTGDKISLTDNQIGTLQNAFSIVLTYNASAGAYGGVDFTLNVLDASIFSGGLAKYTPTGAIGLYVDPDDFFNAKSQLNFGGGATKTSPVTSTLLFANNTNTWETFAGFLENDNFKIVGHLQSLNQPSIQGATLIWEGKIEKGDYETKGVTPEPATVLVLGLGLAGLPIVRRFRKK